MQILADLVAYLVILLVLLVVVHGFWRLLEVVA
jgi:hypothetical protein